MDFQSAGSLVGLLAIVFGSGFLSGLSPCTLPTAVLVVGYVSRHEEKSVLKGFLLTLFFVLGIIFTLVLLGVFFSFIGSLLTPKFLNYFLALILIVMALWMFRVFEFNKGSAGNVFKVKKGSGYLGAFLLGLPFGIAASPCTMPVTASLLAFASTKQDLFFGALLMAVFALGRSIPLLLIGTFTELIKQFKNFEKAQPVIEKIGGAALLGIGLYYLIF
jgi:cytochrome c biogenesis protein CcdA